MTLLGTIGLRDWDEGCLKTLGAEVVTYQVDGSTRGIYACSVPRVDSGFSELNGMIPCQFQDAEDVYQFFRLPCFQFRQNDLSPAFDRQPWYTWVARGPSKDAEEVTLSDGTTGYTKYDNQWRATPFDITYDLMVLGRRKIETTRMLDYALKKFIPPWFIFKVVDSKEELREYDAGEITVSNTSELVDIAERVVSYTISFTVRAEVDLHEDREYPAFVDPEIVYNKFVPSQIQRVNDGENIGDV